jgi:subtilase family serine protease
MRRIASIALFGALSLVVVGLVPDASGAQASPTPGGGTENRPTCPAAPPESARCHAHVVTDGNGKPLASSGPTGKNPADLQSAYNLASASAGGGQTVAIVDAYNDPYAESDMNTYRAKFGIPACTSTGAGCFRKVDQRGGTAYPRSDAGWSTEISLDLDMVSAICPNCKVLLVEADTPSFANLSAAVDRAAILGANAISNSYGGPEYAGEVTDQSHYNHPGIAVTVSSGDGGYGVEFPAASQYVTAVGGTSLKKTTSTRGWTETAWSGAGSGCSKYVAKPSWQTDAGCAHRTVADVAAVADPATGVSVYDSFRSQGQAGWLVYGGTSVASPIIASVYALVATPSTNVPSYPYSHGSSLFDVTSGTNGSCGGSYLCSALPGYDGPTGLGSPNGITAF